MITNLACADGGHVEYTYDDLDRLTGEKKLDSTNGVIYEKTYTYDLVGNRLTAVIDGVTDVYTLGTGNKLSSWGTNGTVSYADAGNVTNITYQDGRSLDIAWNDRYEITSVSTNGTTLESYEYDALGRRVKIENSASTNYLVYDGIHVVAEVNSSGELQKSYTWGPGVDNLLAMTDHTSTQTYFFVKDHLGSVVAIVDSTGTNVVETYEYDAWGNVTAYDGDDVEIDESQIGNRYLWQGREYSWTTGLYNFRARWYDAETGRWLSKDPIGISGGLNQYVFVENDPVMCGDAFGLCEETHDTALIRSVFNNAVKKWIDQGRRHPGEGVENNNEIRLYRLTLGMKGHKYMPCHEQASEMWEEVIGHAALLQNDWQITPMYSAMPLVPHAWIELYTTNQSEPYITLDPWANEMTLTNAVFLAPGYARPHYDDPFDELSNWSSAGGP